MKCLDNIPYEYQKFIKVIFSFNNDSFNINEEKKFEDFKNNILFNIDLKVNKNDSKDINLIEITKISEGKKKQKQFKLISSMLEIINLSICAIKFLLFFNQKNY